jgi:hypothetical protein
MGNDPAKGFSAPPNSTEVPVPERDEDGEWPGLWPCWDGESWRMEEDHRGETGFFGRDPFKIDDVGPLPLGWTKEIALTPLELKLRERNESLFRLGGLDAKSARSLRAIGVLAFHMEITAGTQAYVELAQKLASEKLFLAGLEEDAQKERITLAAIQAEIDAIEGE